MLSKTDELRYIAKLTNAAATAISESKLDDSVLKSEIQINEYDLLRCAFSHNISHSYKNKENIFFEILLLLLLTLNIFHTWF